MMSAYDMIQQERERQVEKGYDAQHDDEHDDFELGWAAQSYLFHIGQPDSEAPAFWPFDAWTPPEADLEGLVIAGALIVAEIERLQREMS